MYHVQVVFLLFSTMRHHLNLRRLSRDSLRKPVGWLWELDDCGPYPLVFHLVTTLVCHCMPKVTTRCTRTVVSPDAGLVGLFQDLGNRKISREVVAIIDGGFLAFLLQSNWLIIFASGGNVGTVFAKVRPVIFTLHSVIVGDYFL